MYISQPRQGPEITPRLFIGKGSSGRPEILPDPRDIPRQSTGHPMSVHVMRFTQAAIREAVRSDLLGACRQGDPRSIRKALSPDGDGVTMEVIDEGYLRILAAKRDQMIKLIRATPETYAGQQQEELWHITGSYELPDDSGGHGDPDAVLELCRDTPGASWAPGHVVQVGRHPVAGGELPAEGRQAA